jgi:hypothetical protein
MPGDRALLFAEFLDRRPVLLPIVQSLLLDAVFLQKTIQVPVRGQARQDAELVTGEAAPAVGFELQAFRSARPISWPGFARAAANSPGMSRETRTISPLYAIFVQDNDYRTEPSPTFRPSY